MRLHTRTETRDGVKCARCARVGLDHRWPCGPHERAKEIAVARLGALR